jgi:hypothetical protein
MKYVLIGLTNLAFLALGLWIGYELGLMQGYEDCVTNNFTTNN